MSHVNLKEENFKSHFKIEQHFHKLILYFFFFFFFGYRVCFLQLIYQRINEIWTKKKLNNNNSGNNNITI